MSSDNQAITVLGQVRAKARHEPDVRAGLQALIEPARRESGCISYEMFEDVEHTGSFYFVEEWESQSALHLHVKRLQPYMNKILPMLSQQLQISVIRPLE
ncbi:putative quinol monooxygenase [Labrys sp. ZIDIC5]|uniref:putative quinol monooxygenase n=1 Tax=Labrys sedimenti TaxID=3106036 RepID=UPI002ACA094A|nr:putative quinol monooxygenase [Labrys sp. ZIDIC5]MDZ5452462.1 putative quinol monooxygenase [Labrys sp. ZIDIC5]